MAVNGMFYKMQVPPEYVSWLTQLPFCEISFGYGGIRLFTPEEMDDGQVACSRSPEGKSFFDGQPGSWKPEWIAIGHDTLLGDPIILDTSIRELAVMTAMHGTGSWDPVIIAGSLAASAKPCARSNGLLSAGNIRLPLSRTRFLRMSAGTSWPGFARLLVHGQTSTSGAGWWKRKKRDRQVAYSCQTRT